MLAAHRVISRTSRCNWSSLMNNDPKRHSLARQSVDHRRPEAKPITVAVLALALAGAALGCSEPTTSEQIEAEASAVGERLENAARATSDAAADMLENTTDAMSDTADEAADMMEDASERAGDMVDDTMDAAGTMADEVEDASAQLADDARKAAEDARKKMSDG
jgi:F0F1-type ATP synthase membrane subunit b/b'